MMKTTERVLVFDFGAGSGRAMLCAFDGERLVLDEIHRFENTPVTQDGALRWDLPRLFCELKTGIKKADKLTRGLGGFKSIGIDTWGVDFAVVDEKGSVAEPPVHYRDGRTDRIMDRVFKKISKEEIYGKTGIQFAQYNTLFQLYALKASRPEALNPTSTLLLMPDLLGYLLSGSKSCEKTIASTTQLLNVQTGEWDWEIIEKLGLPKSIFPPVVQSGCLKGMLKRELCLELNVAPVPVFCVCGHDTASAVLSVPALGERPFAFISSGTWSLLGTELISPLITPEALTANYTNEAGAGGTTRFLKNIAGLWLINECKREWDKSGVLTHARLAQIAEAESGDKFIIDVDDEAFLKHGNMPQKIADYCQRTGQGQPRTTAETARCVFDSLAAKYKKEFEALKGLTDTEFEALHIIGGGSESAFLCGLTAKACGVRVLAGPAEATAVGNAAMQLIALSMIKDIRQAREIIARSVTIREYLP